MSDREDPAPAAEQDRPRSRSRSPPRKSKKAAGLKWKQKPSAADEGDDRRDSRDGRRPRYDDDRGSSSRSGYRGDDSRRDRDRDPTTRRHRSRSRSPRRDRSERDRRDNNRDRDSKPPKRERQEKKAPAAPAVAADGEEMIIVHVNDRLGTKAAIPCFGSDNIGQFKVMVAARIGREPHEILLKRQGERPFKDHITLGDYGISSGVQLDLEVDTGD